MSNDTPARLTCARCRRRLVKPAAIVAGMPLGPVCAAALGAAVRSTPLEAAADRRARRAEAAEEAAFRERQLTLIET